MKWNAIYTGALMLSLAACSTVQATSEAPLDPGPAAEAEITQLVEAMEQAWSDQDAAAWAASFEEDADFTVWFGLRLNGRQAIQDGHQFIFNTIYAGTEYDLEVSSIRFLSDEMALVHLDGWVRELGDPSVETDPETRPVMFVRKQAGEWKVSAFQNTPNFGQARIVNGDIRNEPQFTSLVSPN